jgi:ankyrin repeat protein
MSVAPNNTNNNNNNNTTTKQKESSDGNAIEKAGSRVRKASLNAVHSVAACIPGTAQTQEALIGKSGMLHEAAEHGNIALVTRYVTNQTNQSSRTIMLSSDYENRNALHKACFNGHVGCVKVLLQHSKILRDNIDIKDRFGCTALYLACIKNTVVLDNGSQATSKEVVEIKLEIVRALLEHNAQPNQAKTTQQATALHWCAIHGFDSVVMELIKTFQKNHDAVELMPLLKQLNSRNDLPMDIVGTELYHLRYRYEEQLINVRGEIQEVTQEVDEPEAKTDETTKSVERKHRGLIDSPTKNVSYEEVIMRQSSSKLEEVLNRYEACLVAFIAAVSLDPNKDYNVRWLQSMLIWSCYLGLTKNVEDILAVGRRKSVRLSLTWGGISTQDGRTALHFAALMGHDDIIKQLNKFYKDPSQKKKFVSIEDMQKKKGCCGGKRDAKHMGFVNYPDHFNNTPIHLCAMQAHFPNSFGATESTASILLEMGADATELNAEGRAPASYARGDVRNLFEKKTKEQQGFEGSCYDSPRVKNEKILSFDWVIRFKNFKANGFETIRSIDSDHHQLEMKTYLEGKRCLVRLIEDPKKENMLLLFTATEAVCRHHANEMEIELPVINNRVDRTYESHLHFLFEPLRSRERINILKAIIDMEYDLDVFVRSGIMTDYFPMHETTELESVKLRWTRGWFPEPFRTPDDLMNENKSSVMSGLSTIAGYFGEEKAMYFAFVSFYSLYVAYFLVPFGLLISVYQFYFFFKTGSFQGDLDGVYIPIFAVVVSVWATAMVEKWKRKQNELAFRWDCSDVVVEEGFRAQFWGVEKLNPATLTVIKDFPSSTRLKYRCFGYLIVCLMVGIVIAIFLGVRRFKRHFVTIQPPPYDTVWRSLAGVGQGVTIAIMNEIYKIVAEKLTTIENYPTQTLHDNALIYKIFLFQFINGNMALMSAAFLDSDPVALWTLLITLMFGNQIVS